MSSPVTTLRTAQRQLAAALLEHYPIEEAQSLAWQALEHVRQQPKVRLLMEPEQPLPPAQVALLEQVTARLLRHEPLQYVTGRAHFYGMELRVSPAVLIPRPETEELVERILQRHGQQPGLHVLDLCTGSGCIAIALAQHLPQAQVTGLDVSEEALQIARQNGQEQQVPVQWRQADVLQLPSHALPEGVYDVIVSNPPYVLEREQAQMRPNVLAHEPHLALFVPDQDPLLFYRAITQLAVQRLRPGGWLYFEINEQYGAAVVELLQEAGFVQVQVVADLFGKARMVEGQKPEVLAEPDL